MGLQPEELSVDDYVIYQEEDADGGVAKITNIEEGENIEFTDITGSIWHTNWSDIETVIRDRVDIDF